MAGELVKLVSPSGSRVSVDTDLAKRLKERGFRAPAGRPAKQAPSKDDKK